MKKSEYYKDILTYIEARLGLIQALQDASETKDYYRRQLYLHIVEQRQQEIDRWLNEEVEVQRRTINGLGKRFKNSGRTLERTQKLYKT